jgi:proteasome lid subunit RPN8/RPN11
MDIPYNIYERMLQQAKTEAPVEACGILAGINGKVEKLYKMTNADNSTDHFMMLSHEQFDVVKDIRAKGLEMVAIYHSHPETPARLSDEDIRLALTPDVVYVILSLQNEEEPVIKGFSVKNCSISEVSVSIKKTNK